MTYEKALKAAQVEADASQCSVLVYRSTHNLDRPEEYGIAYTLPMWGERIGERIYPTKNVNLSDAYKSLELND